MKEIQVTNFKFFYKPINHLDEQKKSNFVKVELEMPIEEWERIKPDLLYPHTIKHNRRSSDTK